MAGLEDFCPVMFEDNGVGKSWFSWSFDDLDTFKGAWKVLELALAELEDLLSASVMQVRGVLDAMG